MKIMKCLYTLCDFEGIVPQKLLKMYFNIQDVDQFV